MPMYDIIAEALGVLKHHHPTLPYVMLLSAVYHADLYSFIHSGMSITYDDTIIFDDIPDDKLGEIISYLSNKIPSPLPTLEVIKYTDVVPISQDELCELSDEDVTILLDIIKNGISDIKINRIAG